MFGTTLPTEGTGLAMRGDMEGMLASWESSVTPAAVTETVGAEGISAASPPEDSPGRGEEGRILIRAHHTKDKNSSN